MSALTSVVEALAAMPSPLATIILAMLPVGELRGALPVALLVYHLPLPWALVLAIIGNMLPVYFLLVFFERIATWLRHRSALADKILAALFARTRHRLSASVARYGTWALALFVAVPLPVTGAWTGALAAFVFGLPKSQAFLAILVGVCLSAVIVTALTLGTSFTVKAFIGS